jgi:hypothetical protein
MKIMMPAGLGAILVLSTIVFWIHALYNRWISICSA